METETFSPETAEDDYMEHAESEGGSGAHDRLLELVDRFDFAEGVEAASRWIRDHPLAAVGIAAGVGFVAGALATGGGSREAPHALRETIADVGRELESHAARFGSSAANKLADVATHVADPHSPARTAMSQAAGSVADTLRTAFVALALNKLGEILKRSV